MVLDQVTQRIRDFLTMRYINSLLLTYLLTYFQSCFTCVGDMPSAPQDISVLVLIP